jgi:hypothetical protein
MEKNIVRVGRIYNKKQGAVISKVKVVEKLKNNIYKCIYLSSNKEFNATKETINKWSIYKQIKEKKRLNSSTLLDVCLAILHTEKQAFTPTMLAKHIIDHALYKFSDTAKTPHCTISSRLNYYLSLPNSTIKKDKRGWFYSII